MDKVLETILARRSVRRYLPDSVNRTMVEQLITAGRYAPSARNRQAWKFTAITNPKLIQELKRMVIAGFDRLVLSDSDPKELAATKEKVCRMSDTYDFTFGAPCLIIVSNEANDPNGQSSCACALQNMFLAARELGLGSCWVHQLYWLNRDQTLRHKLEELGIPLSHNICGAGVFGYPDGAIPATAVRKEGTWSIWE